MYEKLISFIVLHWMLVAVCLAGVAIWGVFAWRLVKYLHFESPRGRKYNYLS